ncbi:MAG: response regulator [Syntrophomonadaceae bacterium]
MAKLWHFSTLIGRIATLGCIFCAALIYLFHPWNELTIRLDLNLLGLFSLLGLTALFILMQTLKKDKPTSIINLPFIRKETKEAPLPGTISRGNVQISPRPYIIKKRPSFYHALVLENIPESVVILDKNDHLVYANYKAHEIYGLESKVSQGLPLYHTFGMSESLVQEIKEELAAGHPWQGELQLQLDGQQKTFMYRIAGCDKKLGYDTVMIISTDISESVDNRERAEIANYTQTQFLANISHEIRTPLIGVLGSVSLLEQSRLDQQQMENVAVIQECGEHLLRIINDILDVSKIQLGMESLAYSPCYLQDIFNRVMSTVEPLAREKGLYITAEIEGSKKQLILTDHIKLRQILLNILNNAIKFTVQGGIHMRAQIESRDAREYLVASIADTGIGIERDKIDSIFDPFTQADGSSSRHYGGTGLGLYVCQKQVELMNGTIWLESEMGLGTVFHIRIPVGLHNENTPSDGHTQPEPLLNQGGNNLLALNPVQVLLVEDNRVNRRIVSQMLTNYGFEVTSAQHGLECLRLMQDRIFDIVLMDMQMPVMDGYDATRHISQDPDLSQVPVIAMTAHALAGDREKCFQCGCCDFIAKPFQTEELIAVINRNLMSGRKAHAVSEVPYEQIVNDLMPEFIDSLNENIQDLRRALESGDLEAIQNISHDIKGSAGLYGFKRLSELAALIEAAAREACLPRVRILAANLSHVYEELYSQVS